MAFACDICEKQFTQMTNLMRHKKAVHSGRSFQCDRCGDLFNRQDALKRHIKKHSQDKTHQCIASFIVMTNVSNIRKRANTNSKMAA